MSTFVEDFFAGVESRRHAWPAGRADLHWHLLFDEQAVHDALIAPYRHIADRPGLAPVAAPWLHCTVLHAGPVAEYREQQITDIVERVAKECENLDAFDLTFDRPTIGTVAVECAARPGEPARRLWEITARVDAEVTGGRYPLIPSVYYPHASIAYGTAAEVRADRRALKQALSDHPGEPVVLRAERLCLVAQSHDRRHITWSPIAEVALR
ncbi:2'-5' RNA ligase family protein [Streptomyces sp. NPDC001407]|uniref:2'-5' RNA ligase family protein n=1 Tax=Streptomyces sp. NPDC001407 TaxID=3364573 RepID=UPI0036B9D303